MMKGKAFNFQNTGRIRKWPKLPDGFDIDEL